MRQALKMLMPDREALALLISILCRLGMILLGVIQIANVFTRSWYGEHAGIHASLAAVLFWCALTGWRKPKL